MVRKRANVDGIWQPKSLLGVYLLFGIVTLAVGVGLLAVRHFTLSGIEAARQWVPTPAVVERAAFVRDDDGGLALDLEYRYEFQGKTYRSGRLDLLPPLPMLTFCRSEPR